MKKYLILIAFAFILPLSMLAKEQKDADDSSEGEKKSGLSEFFTGFSGGMMVHAGYMFSDAPDKVFSNTGLGSMDYIKGLPKDGFCFGLGGSLRFHLINHIHLGAEGGMSTMPLMKTGSNVRTAWGGALCDFYTNWGKVRPLIGMSVGGGAMRRLFVPEADVETAGEEGAETNYNSSFVKSPFFYLDPYVGMEFGLTTHMALIVRLDYMLPFGSPGSKLTPNVNWSNFMTPSGPRLYVGVMFGKMK